MEQLLTQFVSNNNATARALRQPLSNPENTGLLDDWTVLYTFGTVTVLISSQESPTHRFLNHSRRTDGRSLTRVFREANDRRSGASPGRIGRSGKT